MFQTTLILEIANQGHKIQKERFKDWYNMHGRVDEINEHRGLHFKAR